jgi:hypothetical protein
MLKYCSDRYSIVSVTSNNNDFSQHPANHPSYQGGAEKIITLANNESTYLLIYFYSGEMGRINSVKICNSN